VTDDRGSQCRLSSKFGAPKPRWRHLLQAAKSAGLQVVGVSFHVGSGCRDATRYELALQDARELFDMALTEFGFHMSLLDIGGGFPGETHSFWNPEVLDDLIADDDDHHPKEGMETIEEHDKKNSPDKIKSDKKADDDNASAGDDSPYMFFMEIAKVVAPMIDALFPDPKVRVIGEPGRYFVAAAATLITNIVGARSNEIDQQQFVPEAISDAKTSHQIFERSREDEQALVRRRGKSFDISSMDEEANDGNNNGEEARMWGAITDELNQYAKHFAKQEFVTQETDAYNDGIDLYSEDFATASDLLGIPEKHQIPMIVHSVEGMTKAIAVGGNNEQGGLLSLAAAGEAAVNGMVLQAVADSSPLQDDYAYYVNDGVYGAFNNLMFDHATVRPRVLRLNNGNGGKDKDQSLYASTVFGPTCDSIDVIARSVLLPKLKIGDWLYFQNMGKSIVNKESVVLRLLILYPD